VNRGVAPEINKKLIDDTIVRFFSFLLLSEILKNIQLIFWQ